MAKKGKGRHSTPEHLDHLFRRGAISEDMYQDFWSSYWRRKTDSSRDELVRFYTEELEDEEEEDGGERLPLRGSVTRNAKEARQQARMIDGYVVRRNKKGQFSKRGKFYQAIRRR